jgi:hypothetical protein
VISPLVLFALIGTMLWLRRRTVDPDSAAYTGDLRNRRAIPALSAPPGERGD